MTDTLPTATLLFHALGLAGLLDWPAVAIPPDGRIGPGRDAWVSWSTSASRRQLARAIGVLVVRQHREPAA